MSASFEAFFPNHDHVNAFAALDLEAGLTWPDRKNLVEVLASYERFAKPIYGHLLRRANIINLIVH